MDLFIYLFIYFENLLPSNSMNVNIICIHYTIMKARNECSIDRRLLQDCVTENRPIIQLYIIYKCALQFN